jgi:hypothetical protein
MELNENTAAAAGGVLAGLAAAWGAVAATLRRMRARAEWKGRMEQAVAELQGDVRELKTDQRAFRSEVREEFAGLRDALIQRS